MTTEAEVRESFAKQGEWCEKLGSPFTALLCRVLGERLDRSTAVGRRVLDWAGKPDALNDSLPLRLTGALHALVLSGAAPTLAAVYPPNPTPQADQLWTLVDDAIRGNEAVILPRLNSAPQTNEVTRSGPLMAGLLVIAHETGLPVSLFELGPSGGLNLGLDRFDHDLGGRTAGLSGSPVRIAPEWQGPPPPQADVKVMGRRGVDLNPLSVENPDHRLLLTAYVWPDQAARLSRVKAAIEVALGDPPKLDQGDAADWLERTLTVDGPPGVARVVMHSIAFSYFPVATQARIRDRLDRVGAAATAASPTAWLRLELDPEFDNQASLRLTLWPDGTERVLGVGHPHGSTFRFF